jgi:hypothetical protein
LPDEAAFGVILWTTDIRALTQFLSVAAGAQVAEQHPGFAVLRVGRSRIELHADEAYRGHPWYDALVREGAARGIGAELRFRVSDVRAAYSAALAVGGRAITPPYNDDGVVECQVMGPDGYMICLWEERGPGPGE